MFGYTLIKKSELNKTQTLLEENILENGRLNRELSEAEFKLKKLEEQRRLLEEELESKKIECQMLDETIRKEKSSNSVTLTISDDLVSITPIVRTKQNSFELLFQNGYLNDSQNSQHAIELAFMLIANEALTQLLEQFESPVRGD